MASVRDNKKATKYKFELTRSAVGGIAILLSCAFLWMFLLGVYAGKKILFADQPLQTTSQGAQGDKDGSGKMLSPTLLTNGEHEKKVF